MSEQQDDRYVNSFRMKEKTFDDGNSIIAVDIHVEDFLKKLKTIPVNEQGFAKLRIVRRKAPSAYGHTHFLSVYTPRNNEEEDKKKDKKKKDNNKGISGKRDDVPF